jgi:hypothetical protein
VPPELMLSEARARASAAAPPVQLQPPAPAAQAENGGVARAIPAGHPAPAPAPRSTLMPAGWRAPIVEIGALSLYKAKRARKGMTRNDQKGPETTR